MKQPILVIKKGKVDRLLKLLTFASVVTSFVFPVIYYSDLPEQIPVHFNATGTADRLASRNTIWFLPVLGAALCLGIHRLIKFPHLFNYPVRITAENARTFYKMSQKSLRIINLIIAASIAYISIEIIFTSMGRSEGLTREFLLIFSTLMLGVPLFILLKMRRVNNNGNK